MRRQKEFWAAAGRDDRGVTERAAIYAKRRPKSPRLSTPIRKAGRPPSWAAKKNRGPSDEKRRRRRRVDGAARVDAELAAMQVEAPAEIATEQDYAEWTERRKGVWASCKQMGIPVVHPPYEVEKVVGKRHDGGRVEYRVRWKDYSEEEDTWEPLANLKRAKGVVEEYESQLRAAS